MNLTGNKRHTYARRWMLFYSLAVALVWATVSVFWERGEPGSSEIDIWEGLGFSLSVPIPRILDALLVGALIWTYILFATSRMGLRRHDLGKVTEKTYRGQLRNIDTQDISERPALLVGALSGCTLPMVGAAPEKTGIYLAHQAALTAGVLLLVAVALFGFVAYHDREGMPEDTKLGFRFINTWDYFDKALFCSISVPMTYGVIHSLFLCLLEGAPKALFVTLASAPLFFAVFWTLILLGLLSWYLAKELKKIYRMSEPCREQLWRWLLVKNGSS